MKFAAEEGVLELLLLLLFIAAEFGGGDEFWNEGVSSNLETARGVKRVSVTYSKREFVRIEFWN